MTAKVRQHDELLSLHETAKKIVLLVAKMAEAVHALDMRYLDYAKAVMHAADIATKSMAENAWFALARQNLAKQFECASPTVELNGCVYASAHAAVVNSGANLASRIISQGSLDTGGAPPETSVVDEYEPCEGDVFDEEGTKDFWRRGNADDSDFDPPGGSIECFPVGEVEEGDLPAYTGMHPWLYHEYATALELARNARLADQNKSISDMQVGLLSDTELIDVYKIPHAKTPAFRKKLERFRNDDKSGEAWAEIVAYQTNRARYLYRPSHSSVMDIIRSHQG